VNAKEWNGIVPLHSSRADVERILGKPQNPKCDILCSYLQEEQNVVIQYTTARNCKDGEVWNVPRNTVIYITLYPKKKPKLSDLKIDISKFKIVDDPEIKGSRYYIDEEEGFSFTATSKTIIDFTYEPSAKDEKLRCKKK
jgi:hypothetical protein